MLNNGNETNRCFVYLQLYIAYLFVYLRFGESGKEVGMVLVNTERICRYVSYNEPPRFIFTHILIFPLCKSALL